MFEEIISKLLCLKANLQVEKEQKVAEAIRAVENEFADNEARIDKMLNDCGYVEPIVEPTEETFEVCDDTFNCETTNNEEDF